VVRVEAGRFGAEYGGRALRSEADAFDRAVDEEFRVLATQPSPERVAEVAELVKRAARQRDAQMTVIRTDMQRFDGYLDMLRALETGYLDLYQRQGALQQMFTGRPVEIPAMPEKGEPTR